MMMKWHGGIEGLSAGYRSGQLVARDVLRHFWEQGEGGDPAVWIARLDWSAIRHRLDELEACGMDDKPLWGVPFAVKDNIDVAGLATTAGCEAFEHEASQTATVVALLLEAGAVLMGKTNLDQFATGLVGTRSPYGVAKNAFNADYVPGGSSSGSAVAVAEGMCVFSLGTDTAGSGRVPAAFNNLVGWKPTRGLVSARGVVPACRTLDCVSIFAATCADASAVSEVVGQFDQGDSYARRGKVRSAAPGRARLMVPRAADLEFFGDAEAAQVFAAAVAKVGSIADIEEVDFSPFREAAALLYGGPWVAERTAAVGEWSGDMLDVTRGIIEGGTSGTAVQAFEAQYRLAELRRQTEGLWQRFDGLLTPTTGTVYRIDEVAAQPVALNTNLGFYTNYMNLLDLCAVAVPCGFLEQRGMPFGMTLVMPAWADAAVLEWGAKLHATMDLPVAKTEVRSGGVATVERSGDGWLELVVCGAHLDGLPLNHQLTERGGRLVRSCRSAPRYRFYALAGGPPFRPGMVRVAEGEVETGIEVEVWSLPEETVGSFLAGIPAPLGLGKVELDDGTWVTGFTCESAGTEAAEDITSLASWRKFLQGQAV